MKKIVVLLCIFVIFIKIYPPIFNNIPKKENSEILKQENPQKVPKIKVYLKNEDKVVEMDIDEYLVGVITAEMPAVFHIEALKAQAVAARTYTYRKALYNNKNESILKEHKGADVCTDFKHCKAYMSKNDAVLKWGREWEDKYYSKICLAVSSTKNEVIEYNNEPIEAVFHSMSSGKTENSEDVWGTKKPYLKSVSSYLEEKNPNYETKVTISLDEFKKRLKNAKTNIVFKGSSKEYIKNIQRTQGGSVKSLEICKISFTGREIREIFNLRSANFTLKIDDKNVVFDVLGYGHGVGMSQNGANNLANAGKNYKQILKTYYQNIEIIEI